uniref:Sulfotransferase n=1 Tax=Brassica campestris TaxID=3711 RepID=M4F6E4_BRACM
MFEAFCNGAIFYGPFWDNLLGYRRRSLEDPTHVLFMRYEEMKAEPRDQINRLAEFLGYPFTKQEEDNGFVDEVLDLSSLPNLNGLEVNKTGK